MATTTRTDQNKARQTRDTLITKNGRLTDTEKNRLGEANKVLSKS